jgi:hypothetical protein
LKLPVGPQDIVRIVKSKNALFVVKILNVKQCPKRYVHHRAVVNLQNKDLER